MFKLRDYQKQCIDDVRREFQKGNKKVCLTLPTGSGKTIIGASMIKGAIERGKRCIFIVHRRELVKQSLKAFRSIGIDCGVVANGFDFVHGKDCYIASVSTLVRRLRVMKGIELVFFDEAHHCRARSWNDCWNAFFDSYMVGLTATPRRLDKKGLGNCFDSLVIGPSVQELIDSGSLSDYKYYAPSNVDLSSIKTLGGDYKKDELAELMDQDWITGSAIEHYKRFGQEKRFIVFCVSIDYSKKLVNQFNAEGIHAYHVDGKSHMDERDRAIDDFRRGNIKVLSNVGLFGEGFDLPIMDGVIILRPTKSVALHLQMVGRCLRPVKGKTHAVILDHVGNYLRHGLPSDERNWSLSKSDKNEEGEGVPNLKECKECFYTVKITEKICPECGYEFVTAPRGEIYETEGDLVEVDRKAEIMKRKQEVRDAKDFDSLVALGISRGYNRPQGWAHNILKERDKWKWKYKNKRFT